MSTLYRPLADNRRSIRAINLPIKRDKHDVLQLTLEEIPLLDFGEPSPGTHTYAAISYEWGPETPLCELSVNGHRALVRRNIWTFLDHCCSTGLLNNLVNDMKIDSIWVDAICINQADVGEKNAQVQAMSSIFWNACAVITWLGQTSKNSRLGEFIPTKKQHAMAYHRYRQRHDGPTELTPFQACDPKWRFVPTGYTDIDGPGRYPENIDAFFEMVVARAATTGNTATATHGAFAVGTSVRGALEASDALDLQHDLWCIFSDLYWSRLWIVQELILAQVSYFVSGRTLLETRVLIRLATNGILLRCHESLSSTNPTVQLVDRIEDIRQRRQDMLEPNWAYQYGLLDLIAKFAGQRCQDPKDHIFGLQGVAKSNEVTVDYNLSLEELFCMVLHSSLPENEQSCARVSLSSVSALFSVLNLAPRQVKTHLDDCSKPRDVEINSYRFELVDSGKTPGPWNSVSQLYVESGYKLDAADADDIGVCLEMAPILYGDFAWYGLTELADEPRLVYTTDIPRDPTERHPRSAPTLRVERLPPEVLLENFCYKFDRHSLTLDLRVVLWIYELAESRLGSLESSSHGFDLQASRPGRYFVWRSQQPQLA